jgi:hypothetical protein
VDDRRQAQGKKAMTKRAVFQRLATIAALALSFSAAAQVTGDQLVIRGIPQGEDVFVMMDAPGPAGCINDRVFRTRGVIPLPNLGTRSGCRSEVTVFSSSHRMTTRALAWTAQSETLVVDLTEPLIDVPVRVWITYPQAEAFARSEIKMADVIYRANKVGVRFVPEFRPLPNAPAAIASGDCGDNVREIKDRFPDLYVPRTINVYYVDKEFTGRNCAHHRRDATRLDANVIFVGNIGSPTTLAHELGHAFGLRRGDEELAHVDDVGTFTSTNVMWVATNKFRQHFTIGQTYRMNLQDDTWGGTVLQQNGLLKPGERIFRECRLLQTKPDPECPLPWLPWPGQPVAHAKNESAPDAARVASNARSTRALAYAKLSAAVGDCDDELPKRRTTYRPVDVPYYLSAVRHGPLKPHRESIRKSASAAYDTLVEQGRKNPELAPDLSRDEYVARYLDNYDRQVRRRAVAALSAIRTPASQTALQVAYEKAERPELRRAIEQALQEK